MNELSVLSIPHELPASPATLPQDTISRDESKGLPFLDETKSAAWVKQGAIADRRTRLRSNVAFEVQLIPLNLRLQPIGPVYTARLVNYSSDGASLEHEEVIAEPYVQIRWRDSHEQEHAAILRLKWCRNVSRKTFLSGGRVVGMN